MAPRTALSPSPWLLGLDVDGTLLTTGSPPSDDVVHAIRDLAAAGHHPVLATGRSLIGAAQVVAWLGLRDAWIVTSHGAITARIAGGKIQIVERHFVDEANVERIVRHVVPKLRLRIAAEIPGIGHRVTDPFAEHELPGQHVRSNLEGMWAAPAPRITLVGDGAAWLADDFHAMGLVTHAPHSGWIDVMAAGVRKSAALERIRVALGISHARTIAVGDGTNDIDMLRWAARGVAMGQASATVRDAANEITGTITDDGVLPILRDVARLPAGVR